MEGAYLHLAEVLWVKTGVPGVETHNNIVVFDCYVSSKSFMYPISELQASFVMWGSASWIRGSDPAILLYTTAIVPSILCLVSTGITYEVVPIFRY